jgi:hypothetical protein
MHFQKVLAGLKFFTTLCQYESADQENQQPDQ